MPTKDPKPQVGDWIVTVYDGTPVGHVVAVNGDTVVYEKANSISKDRAEFRWRQPGGALHDGYNWKSRRDAGQDKI